MTFGRLSHPGAHAPFCKNHPEEEPKPQERGEKNNNNDVRTGLELRESVCANGGFELCILSRVSKVLLATHRFETVNWLMSRDIGCPPRSVAQASYSRPWFERPQFGAIYSY